MKTSSAVWSLLYGLGVLLGLMAPLALAVPQDIVFVFDNSGSMRRADPGFAARAAARSFLLDLPTDAQVAVVVFDEKVVLSVPLALVGDGKALGASLNGVDYRGPYTNSPAAVERALDELKTHAREGAQRSVVLMSDGIVDTGNAQVDVERRVWLRDKLTQEAAANHVRLFGLAFTKSADLSLMKSLATSTQGDYFHAYTLPELPSAFAKLRVALFQEPPVLAGAAAPPALPVAPAPTAEVAAPTTPSSAPALAAPALAAPTLAAPAAPAAPALAAPAAPAAPALAAPTLAAPALAAPTLAPTLAAPAPVAPAQHLTPEEQASLEQMSRETGVPLAQLLDELARGQKMEPRPVVAPVAPSPVASQAAGVGLGLAVGVGLALVGFGAWWWLRRRARPAEPKAASMASTAGPAKPSKIPEGWLIDSNGHAGLAPYRLTDKPLMVCRVTGSDSDYLDYYLIEKSTIGRRHAVIKYKDRSFWVVDQGSVNGTFVNDEKVAGERQLRNGDLLKFHKFEFEFQHPGVAGAEPTWVGLPAEQTVVAAMDATQAAPPVFNPSPAGLSAVIAAAAFSAAPTARRATLADDVTREGDLESLEEDRDNFFNAVGAPGEAPDLAGALPPLLDDEASEGIWDDLPLAQSSDDLLAETLQWPTDSAALSELSDPLAATVMSPQEADETLANGFLDDRTIAGARQDPRADLASGKDFYTATTMVPAATTAGGLLEETVTFALASTLPPTRPAGQLGEEAGLTMEQYLTASLESDLAQDPLSATQDDFEMFDTQISDDTAGDGLARTQELDRAAQEIPFNEATVVLAADFAQTQETPFNEATVALAADFAQTQEIPFNEATIVLANSPLARAKREASEDPASGA